MSEEEALAAARSRIEDVRARIDRLDDNALDLIFREARSHNWWTDRDVSDDQLREIWDVMKYGTTSANTLPARLLFVRSKESKEKLAPCLNPTNVDKTMAAPVTAIIATDFHYFDNFEKLYPPRPAMKERHASDPEFAARFGLQQGTLQGAYFIIAARALGLDCGAMGGFDNAKVDAAFLAGCRHQLEIQFPVQYRLCRPVRHQGPPPLPLRFRRGLQGVIGARHMIVLNAGNRHQEALYTDDDFRCWINTGFRYRISIEWVLMKQKLVQSALICIMPLVWAVISPPASAETYVSSLHAYTLGFPKVEFYRAVLVTTLKKPSPKELLATLKIVCEEFPKLDKYILHIVSDMNFADMKYFEHYVPTNHPNYAKLSNVYIAQLHPSEPKLTMFPFGHVSGYLEIFFLNPFPPDHYAGAVSSLSYKLLRHYGQAQAAKSPAIPSDLEAG